MNEDDAWVRQQLAALPSPPIPVEVRARLDAALAAEAAATAPAPVAATIPQPRRSVGRRMILGLAGAAAALTLFAVVDPLSMTGLDPTSGTTAGDAALAPTASQDPQDSAELGDAPAEDRVAEVLVASNTNYTQATLATQAVTLAAASGPASASSESAAAAAACVASIPAAVGDLVVVDRATYEGRPAQVVVLRDGNEFHVVVQETSCTRTDPAIRLRVTVEAPPGE